MNPGTWLTRHFRERVLDPRADDRDRIVRETVARAEQVIENTGRLRRLQVESDIIRGARRV